MSEYKEQLKFMLTLVTSIISILISVMVTWVATEIRSIGPSVVRLETIQQERTEQMKRMENLVVQIMPRAEIETKLLDIRTELSGQRLESTRLSLEIEKIKNFDSLTHPSVTKP